MSLPKSLKKVTSFRAGQETEFGLPPESFLKTSIIAYPYLGNTRLAIAITNLVFPFWVTGLNPVSYPLTVRWSQVTEFWPVEHGRR